MNGSSIAHFGLIDSVQVICEITGINETVDFSNSESANFSHNLH